MLVQVARPFGGALQPQHGKQTHKALRQHLLTRHLAVLQLRPQRGIDGAVPCNHAVVRGHVQRIQRFPQRAGLRAVKVEQRVVDIQKNRLQHVASPPGGPAGTAPLFRRGGQSPFSAIVASRRAVDKRRPPVIS